jgi:hypothetical protein
MNVSDNTLRIIASEILTEELGVLGDIILDETIMQLGISNGELPPGAAMAFLKLLVTNLPTYVDRKNIIISIRDAYVAARKG